MPTPGQGAIRENLPQVRADATPLDRRRGDGCEGGLVGLPVLGAGQVKYPGGKNSPGVAQRIISEIPRHRVFVELFGGSAAIARLMLPSERTIVVDKDAAAVARFGGGIRRSCPRVELIHGDAVRWLMSIWDQIQADWCIYADPPYHPETLRGPQKYRCRFDAGDHLRLLSLLLELPCQVLISGYRHPLYDVTLSAWRRIGYWTYDRTGRRRSESLWMNFPRPRVLHDPRFVGTNRRTRERRRRRITTFAGRIHRADDHELQWLAGLLDAEMDRRRLEYSTADFRDAHPGSDAGSGDGRGRRENGGGRSTIELRPETHLSAAQAAPGRPLVLSLFPGIDLLGRAFREAGFCVVAGPEKLLGQDVADFGGVPRKFDGIIGGPPCQDFSSLNRTRNSQPRRAVLSTYGAEMVRQFLRVVDECRPTWWLMENVPAVPDVVLGGYEIQRLGITDVECGGVQRRNRHFQFGHVAGWIIRPDRVTMSGGITAQTGTAAVLASDGKRRSRSFPAHCRLMGLDRAVTLPGWTRLAKYTAVGNGVPMAMGRAIARAVIGASPRDVVADCVCGCGRRIELPARHATATCRKIMERRRRGERPVIVYDPVTARSLAAEGNGDRPVTV